jgi:glycosyltransferase involved in cell wall biosynthesis
MKIALINLGRTGAGPVYAFEIAKALSQKVELLCIISSQSENIDQWRASGLDIFEVDTYNNFREFVSATLRLKSLLTIVKRIKEFKPDFIYTPMIHLWTALIGFLTPGIPKILTIHDISQHDGEQNLLLDFVREVSLRQSTLIILLSEIFRQKMITRGFPTDKIIVIPHGQFSYYHSVSTGRLDHLSPDLPVILFFGRIYAYKGLDTLLNAFPIIRQNIPNAQLLIAGNGDLSPYQGLLEGQEGIVIVNKWIEEYEVANYFLQANLVVLPYKESSQSGVIPTAYAFKLPVVATRTGGIQEQVVDHQTGLLVEPDSPGQLAEACISLLTKPELARSMGNNGYKMAMEEWSWEKAAEKITTACRLCQKNLPY